MCFFITFTIFVLSGRKGDPRSSIRSSAQSSLYFRLYRLQVGQCVYSHLIPYLTSYFSFSGFYQLFSLAPKLFQNIQHQFIRECSFSFQFRGKKRKKKERELDIVLFIKQIIREPQSGNGLTSQISGQFASLNIFHSFSEVQRKQ